MRILKFVLAGLIAGGAIGFIPTYLQLREARVQLEQTQENLSARIAEQSRLLAVSQVHSRLGLLASAARSEDFPKAQSLSTKLYDSVDAAAELVEDSDAKRRLLTLRQTRDQVTASLARADPTIADTLDRVFVLLGDSIDE